DTVARIRANPLFRALRVDKLTYAALEATLLAYVRQEHTAIPALRVMRLNIDEIRRRAEALAETLRRSNACDLAVDIVEGASVIGGGAAPGASLPTVLLALGSQDFSADELARHLRSHEPPIVARVEQGRVLLDLRTVFPEQDASIADALRNRPAG
ncbi:MAG TPA: hypothetical protein VE734_11205, partial [Terriglobales bacterium]|nr:hypothetical protein [Terriglobales bacterium]